MYYEHFGLREAPFKFLPSNTLFLSGAHLEGLAALEWAFNEPSGLTLLVGEVGTGKTMLIHSLIARIKDDKIRIAQVSNPTMNFDEMLGSILQQLNINPAGKGKLYSLQALKTFVSDPESKDRVILIFDEAQGLSDEILEELRLLSNSRPPQRHALQIILVGQPELVQRLTDPKLRALNQRIGARALLRPLRSEEVSEYVNCLIRAQGARQEIFTRGALEMVSRLSSGLPRKINNLCHNALIHAYSERSPVVEPRHIQDASLELENLLETSNYRDQRTWRDAWHWTLGRAKPIVAACALVLVVVVGAMGLDRFERRRPGASTPQQANMDTSQIQPAGQFQQAAAAPAAPAAPAANHTAVLSNPPSTAANGPSTQIVSADAPQTSRTRGSRGAARGASIAAMTTAAGNRSTLADSAAPEEPAIASAAYERLTPGQKRRLQYEIKRARSSYDVGRYNNSIWHSKRALLIDPGNTEIRDLMQRAQEARSNRSGAPVHDSPVASADRDSEAIAAPAAGVPAEAAPAQSAPAQAAPAQAAPSGPDNFSEVARSEISEGDAYMREGKYDLALRKFLTAAVLDPDNQTLEDRIQRAREAQGSD